MDFVSSHALSRTTKETPVPLYVIDGRPIESGAVTHSCSLRLNLGQRRETINFDVTKLGQYPLVLGISWLRSANPRIDWRRNTISIGNSESPYSVKALPFVPTTIPNTPNIAWIDSTTLNNAPDILDLPVETLVYSEKSLLLSVSSEYGPRGPTFPDDLPDSPEYIEKLRQVVPSQYHDLISAFSKQKADTLPPHRPYDLSIDLEPGKTPPFGPLYSLSELELKALSEWLEENLSKGFIRASKSPAGARILLSRRKTVASACAWTIVE